MISTYDFLVRRATRYWHKGEPLPIDLFYELLGEGIDVTALEAIHMRDPA